MKGLTIMLSFSLVLGLGVTMFGTFEPLNEIKNQLSDDWFAIGIHYNEMKRDSIQYDITKIPESAIVTGVP